MWTCGLWLRGFTRTSLFFCVLLVAISTSLSRECFFERTFGVLFSWLWSWLMLAWLMLLLLSLACLLLGLNAQMIWSAATITLASTVCVPLVARGKISSACWNGRNPDTAAAFVVSKKSMLNAVGRLALVVLCCCCCCCCCCYCCWNSHGSSSHTLMR